MAKSAKNNPEQRLSLLQTTTDFLAQVVEV